MCGIIAAAEDIDLAPAITGLAHRGPDSAATALIGGIALGHTRLAVQDVSDASSQPFTDGPVTVAYNGELFNAAKIRAAIQAADPRRTWRTSGDTEVIAAALNVLGPAQALPLLDAMFAIAWTDTRRPGVLYCARDRYGEIPLHLHRGAPVLIASERKAFRALGRRGGKAVIDCQPGTWWEIPADGRGVQHRFHRQNAIPANEDLDSAAAGIAQRLSTAVTRRMISDVPICTLLSGGIDSAIITRELAERYPDLIAYTARMDPRSRDLRCARQAADYLGVKLVEVDIPPPTASDLSGVIFHIEMNYKAQVEIAWPCLILARRMREDGFKVTYSGEGSDELWASYGFAYHGLQKKDWFTYRRDLIMTQARRNFPRVNKAFMSQGIEARLPFLDPDVVDYALSLPRSAVQDGPSKPKAVLQKAYIGRLPESIITRPKAAFQDALGLKAVIGRSLPNPVRYYRAEEARIYG